MKALETQLWDYIDGNLSAIENEEIAQRIASEPEVKKMYLDFLNFEATSAQLELDEPSLSFTRNVMEQVQLMPDPLTLKTKVDQRIVSVLAVFFGAILLSLWLYAISQENIPNLEIKMNTDFFESKELWIAVLFINLILGLLFLDRFFRRKLYPNKMA